MLLTLSQLIFDPMYHQSVSALLCVCKAFLLRLISVQT